MERSVCPSCNRILEGHPSFCSYCGGAISGAARGTATPPIPAAPSATGLQPSSYVLAGFWKRFGAVVIDGLITSVPIWILSGIATVAVPGASFTEISVNEQVLQSTPDIPSPEMIAAAFMTAIFIGVLLIASVLYYALLEGGASGATLGKRAMGIRVVDATSGGSIGFGRGVGRYFARWISAIPFYLGYLWMLWDHRRQTWHDKMVNCLVVEVSRDRPTTVHFD